MDLGLKDKAIVIVGGTAGMGFATAEILADEGAKLAVIGRNEAKTEHKARALRERGADVLSLLADGSRRGEVERAIDQAAAHFGRLDGLAVTAGPMAATGPFLGFTEADWETYYQSILMTTVRSCRAAIPHLQAAGGGAMVVTAAYSIRAPKPQLIPYVVMKAAVAALAKNLATAFGPDKIRVNCICPGAIATEALDGATALAVARYGEPADQALDRYMREEWNMQTALGRAGRPRELGELYAFLLSDKAAYMTGAIINQDGGTNF